jgi:3',5'-cyclic AMP phosphodiesterase CpdA
MLNKSLFTKATINGILKLLLIFTCLSLVVLSGCVPDQEASAHFYFIQITDTHFDEPGSEERIEKVINAVNNLPMEIECVVHTGDITQEKLANDSTVNNAIALFNKIKMPVHFLPGNHDILKKRYNETKKSYLNHFGNLTTYQEYNGVVFLLIFTEPLAQSFSDSSYNPLLELETGLKQASGKPVIVFHHTPSIEDFYKNKMHDGWKKEVRDKWSEVLNQHNVKAVIAGHFHRDEHHWIGKVPLYICAPISAYWGRQLTYRIYEYKDGKIGYRTQYLQ